MTIYFQKYIQRSDLKANPDTLYVFGDNMERRGYGGQAKEMRGEPNAVGIPTKVSPSMASSAFLTDDMFHTWMSEAKPDFDRITEHPKVIWPYDGIGSGRARLRTSAPKILTCINNFLSLELRERGNLEWNKNGLFKERA